MTKIQEGHSTLNWTHLHICISIGLGTMRLCAKGHNVHGLGLLTMGEAWHNNHHAYPESARLGLEPGQPDPSWWVLSLLRFIGLVKNVRLPENLPPRKELHKVVASSCRSTGTRSGSAWSACGHTVLATKEATANNVEYPLEPQCGQSENAAV